MALLDNSLFDPAAAPVPRTGTHLTATLSNGYLPSTCDPICSRSQAFLSKNEQNAFKDIPDSLKDHHSGSIFSISHLVTGNDTIYYYYTIYIIILSI